MPKLLTQDDLNVYNSYPNAGWWKTKQRIAHNMDDSQLAFARKDSFEASKCLPQNEGKYMDENSIYVREQNRRRKNK